MDTEKLKVIELFGGIGACTKALERLGIPHEVVDYVEIDKYAVKSYNAVHGTSFEPQDVTKWDKDIEVDLIMHGSPCQDFSSAGKQAGGDKGSGTRSSLMYETIRIVEKLKPKFIIWENVKNLLSKTHRHNFDAYQETMAELGYNNHFQVLNAKDYGVPQNRERVFTVSIRKDIEDTFSFPEKIELERRLKDVLEDEVDEKYFLSEKQIHGMTVTKFNQYKLERLLKDKEGNADTLKARFEGCPQCVTSGATENQREVCNRAIEHNLVEPNDVIEYTFHKARMSEMDNGEIKKQNKADNQVMSTLVTNPQKLGVCVDEQIPIRNATKQGYDLAHDGDGVDLSSPYSTTKRGRVGHGVSKTLTTGSSMGTVDGMRIRKLTPKECWRLMGFDDNDFEKAEKVNSNAQLYKQAGNSIVVNVLESILGNLIERGDAK